MPAEGEHKHSISQTERITIAALVLVAMVYIGWPCHRYFTDGLSAAYLIETSHSWVVHPNHPLMPLLPQAYLNWFPTSGVYPGLIVMITWSMVFGIISCTLLAMLLLRAGLSIYSTAFGLFTFAFSAGPWYFNTTASQYSTALALNILCLVYLQNVYLNRPGGPRMIDLVLAGFLTGLAIAGHQVNGVLIFAGLYVFYMTGLKKNRHVGDSIAYFTITTITALGIYISAGALLGGTGSIQEFIAWQKSYVTRPWYWADGVIDSIVRSSRGITETHLAHVWNPVVLNANSGEWWEWISKRAMQLAVLIFLLIESVRAMYLWVKGIKRTPVQWFGMMTWIPLVIFSFMFTPESINYRIFYLPGFLLLILPSIETVYFPVVSKNHLWVIPMVFIFCLFISNFTLKFLPYSKPSNNPYIYEAEVLSDIVGPRDMVIYSGALDEGLRADYVRYFTGAETVLLGDLIDVVRSDPDQLIKDLTEYARSGHSVVIHEDALYSEEDVRWLNEFYGKDIREGELVDFLDRYVDSYSPFMVNDKLYFVPEIVVE